MKHILLSLEQAGIRQTPARIAVLKLLSSEFPWGVTADGIYLSLCHQQQRISLPTIYRTLADMEKAGMVGRRQQQQAGSAKVHYVLLSGFPVSGQQACTGVSEIRP